MSIFKNVKQSYYWKIIIFSLIAHLTFVLGHTLIGCTYGYNERYIYCDDIDYDDDGYYPTTMCGEDVDCDNSDPNNWHSCSTCKDNDGDNSYINCDKYVTLNGPDCDDNDPNIFSNPPELCDGIDNNICPDDFGYGLIDEGCLPSGLTGKIAFYSDRDDNDNDEIYVMDADGTNQTNITNNPANYSAPAWSPDGGKIAFVRHDNIYVMDADGSNQTMLAGIGKNEYPAWSPDGSKIAFRSNRDGDLEIYVMDADGTNQTNITNNPANESDPAWSPDGGKIAFVRHDNIYVMDADGSNLTRLTTSYKDDGYPAWSPAGSKIAFNSNRDGRKYDIFAMDADGNNQINITKCRKSSDSYPAWSPDGSKIAFRSDRDGDLEIYVMNADGSNQTNITNNPAYDSDPAWIE